MAAKDDHHKSLEIWERQPGETNQAWTSFKAYRDLGPGRSLSRAAAACGKKHTALLQLSSKYQWVRRAEEFDREMDRIHREEMAAARREMAKRHAQQAKALQAVAMRALKAKYGDNLEGITAESLKHDDILKTFVEAAKLERVACGEPESIVEQQINGGLPESDRKPVIPIAAGGRIDEALALLEAARARAAGGAAGSED